MSPDEISKKINKKYQRSLFPEKFQGIMYSLKRPFGSILKYTKTKKPSATKTIKTKAIHSP